MYHLFMLFLMYTTSLQEAFIKEPVVKGSFWEGVYRKIDTSLAPSVKPIKQPGGPSSSKQASDSLMLPDGKTIVVNQFNFMGNQVVSTNNLQQMAAPYRGRALSQSDLDSLSEEIMQVYQSKGYNKAKVMIPAKQNLSGQTLMIQISEGKKSE